MNKILFCLFIAIILSESPKAQVPGSFSFEGITIYTALIPAQTTELRVNLPNANPGIHILKLQDEKECYVSKIIMQ